MESTIITAIIGLITTIGSGFGSWFFTRKKYNTEVDNNIIENMKQSLEFYMRLSDDNKNRLDEALKRNETLEDEVRELRKQVYDLMVNICLDLQCKQRVKETKPTTRYTANKNAKSVKPKNTDEKH